MTTEEKAAMKYEVPAAVRNLAQGEQCGHEIYSGNCPRCGLLMTVNGTGKRPCNCGQMLQFG